MADILAFFKAALKAILKLLGVEFDEAAAEDFADNVESAIKDVVDYGNGLVG